MRARSVIGEGGRSLTLQVRARMYAFRVGNRVPRPTPPRRAN